MKNIIYPHTVIVGIVLSLLSSWYLIADNGVANDTALPLLWSLGQSTLHNDFSHISSHHAVLAYLINALTSIFGLAPEFSAYLVMVCSHVAITSCMILIARALSFSLLSQWSLLFLLLSHPNFNDFRTYIISEPLFWALLLLAIYLLLRFYRSHTVIAIGLWLALFLLASFINVAAWFWLLLFPFGALFWKPWRRLSVLYALIGYACVVGVLIFLPIYQGASPFSWFVETIVKSPTHLSEALSLNNNNWVQKDDRILSSIFVLSGASSLVVVRTLIAFSIICLILAIYALMRRLYRVIDQDALRIMAYAIGFDWFISVVLLIIGEDSNTILSFSTSLLLMFFAALGLSYVFKKIATKRYSDLTTLVIIWCCVGYFASAFIIFGPRKDFLKTAGQSFAKAYPEAILYSQDPLVLFYSGRNPLAQYSIDEVKTMQLYAVNVQKPIYYAYFKHRKRDLPESLVGKKAVMQFSNPRQDTILVYRIR